VSSIEDLTETGVSEKSPRPDLLTASPTSREEDASIVLLSRKSFFDFEVLANAPVSGVRKADFTWAPSGNMDTIVSFDQSCKN
jgi:hypothetical protein